MRHFLQLLTPPPPLPCPQLATTDLSIKANSNKSKRCWILVLLTRVYSVTPLSTSRLPSEECCMEVNLFGRKLFPWNAKSWYSDFYYKTWSGEIMFLGYHLASNFFLNFVTLVADFEPKFETWSRQIMFYTKNENFGEKKWKFWKKIENFGKKFPK